MKSAPGKSNGFTLIEILIVVTIMSLLFGIGYAGYRQYARRQQLVTLVRQLQGDLRSTQEASLSGTKPAGVECDSPEVLDGYNINAGAITGGYGYWITAICSGGNIRTKNVDLPTGFTIIRAYSNTPPATVLSIKPLGQGTNMPNGTNAIFTITDVTGATGIVTLTWSGEVK